MKDIAAWFLMLGLFAAVIIAQGFLEEGLKAAVNFFGGLV